MGIDYICSHSLPDTKMSKMNSVFLLGDRFQKSKEGEKMKKIMYWLSKLTCAVAMGMAVASVNSTCFFTAYQPDVPESLDHD